MSGKPFAYSPNEFDDWGMIRASDGISFEEHRRRGTDPYKAFGQKVVSALNESEKL